jgi:hypothetical protein
VIKTLLVDGDNLFKIGFHGAKDVFNDGAHVGGVFHFVSVLRKFLEEHTTMIRLLCFGMVILIHQSENPYTLSIRRTDDKTI